MLNRVKVGHRTKWVVVMLWVMVFNGMLKRLLNGLRKQLTMAFP